MNKQQRAGVVSKNEVVLELEGGENNSIEKSKEICVIIGPSFRQALQKIG